VAISVKLGLSIAFFSFVTALILLAHLDQQGQKDIAKSKAFGLSSVLWTLQDKVETALARGQSLSDIAATQEAQGARNILHLFAAQDPNIEAVILYGRGPLASESHRSSAARWRPLLASPDIELQKPLPKSLPDWQDFGQNAIRPFWWQHQDRSILLSSIVRDSSGAIIGGLFLRYRASEILPSGEQQETHRQTSETLSLWENLPVGLVTLASAILTGLLVWLLVHVQLRPWFRLFSYSLRHVFQAKDFKTAPAQAASQDSSQASWDHIFETTPFILKLRKQMTELAVLKDALALLSHYARHQTAQRRTQRPPAPQTLQERPSSTSSPSHTAGGQG